MNERQSNMMYSAGQKYANQTGQTLSQPMSQTLSQSAGPLMTYGIGSKASQPMGQSGTQYTQAKSLQPIASSNSVKPLQKKEFPPDSNSQIVPEKSETKTETKNTTKSEEDEEKKRKDNDKEKIEEGNEDAQEEKHKSKGSVLLETFKIERELEDNSSKFKRENSIVSTRKSFEKIIKKPKENFNFKIESDESLTESASKKINFHHRERNRRLIPFFIQKNYITYKPSLDLDKAWFVKGNENSVFKKPFHIAEKDLEKLLENQDELIDIFGMSKVLATQFNSLDTKYRNRIRCLRDLKTRAKSTYGFIDNEENKNRNDIYLSILNRVPSKASQYSSKWVRSDPAVDASKLFNNFSKRLPSQDDKSDQPPEKNELKLNLENAWKSAKQHPVVSDQKEIKKREEDGRKFVESLMRESRYEGLTKGKFHMPVADFPFGVPVPKKGEAIRTGGYYLKILYEKHLEQLTNKTINIEGLERTISSVEFIDPNLIELPNDKLTGNK